MLIFSTFYIIPYFTIYNILKIYIYVCYALKHQLYHMLTILGRSITFGVDDEDIPFLSAALRGKYLTETLLEDLPRPVPDPESSTGA